MNGGHAERFRVGVEIIEASERVISEARGDSVNEVGALGVLEAGQGGRDGHRGERE